MWNNRILRKGMQTLPARLKDWQNVMNNPAGRKVSLLSYYKLLCSKLSSGWMQRCVHYWHVLQICFTVKVFLSQRFNIILEHQTTTNNSSD